MIYRNFFFLFSFTIFIYSCNCLAKEEQYEKKSDVSSGGNLCGLIKQFLSDFQKTENVDSVLLNNKFIKWDESVHFDFKINGISWLPKSESERAQRLLSKDLIDPYPILYLFAFPATDSLFNKYDKSYMRTQIGDSVENCSCVDNRITILKTEDENSHNKIAITKPLFSVDMQKATFVVYSDYSYTNGTIHGIAQNFYYIRTTKGWEMFFSTNKWIL